MITVREVATKRDLQKFIRLPWMIYKGIEQWVPPLLSEEKKLFDPEHHPFYKHSKVKLFLAEKNGNPVGRIAGIVNFKHNEFHNDRVGFFGFFECINDQEVASALFDKVAEFLRSQDRDTIRGPMNFSTNETCGLLIEGYELPPFVMMPYNPPYYKELIERYGFSKAKDLYAYCITRESVSQSIFRLAEGIKQRTGVTLRAFNKRNFLEEVERIREIYNSAWEKNWGFVPMTDEEFYYMADQMKRIVDPRLCIIGEYKDKPVGFMLNLPNINILLKKMNGRLFPFGVFIWLFGLRKIKEIRTITFGIIKEFRRRGIDILFYSRLYELSQEMGLEIGEFSWILEDNYLMCRGLERANAKRYKTYRIFDYPLS